MCMPNDRSGAATRDTRSDFVRKHLEEVGLDGDIAQYNELGSLSGGQKVKVVIAASLWNKPQVRYEHCQRVAIDRLSRSLSLVSCFRLVCGVVSSRTFYR